MGMESRTVRCPGCSGDSLYAPSNPYRPFCSKACKNHDFGAWASEQHRLPDDTPSDDFDNPSYLPTPPLPQ